MLRSCGNTGTQVAVFKFNVLFLVVSKITGGPKFTLGALRPLDAPSRIFLYPKRVYLFNFLAVVVSEILGWSQIYIRGPLAEKFFYHITLQ